GDATTFTNTTDGGTNWFGVSGGTTVHYNAVSSYAGSATTLWRVGSGGLIQRSDDNGTGLWTTQTSGTSQDLQDVHFVDVITGWTVGASGTILKTTTGGSTWTSQTSGSAQNLKNVHAIDTSTAYVTGSSGTILKTTNGGTTWTAQTSGTTHRLWGLSCTDASTCWAAGENGVLLKTTNGGTTWTAQTSGTSQVLYGIQLLDANTGYVAGASGTILKTTNGGTAWTAQTSGTTRDLYNLFCIDTSTCVVVGTVWTILRTTNSGTAWTTQAAGTAVELSSVDLVSGGTGWAVGASGTILKTTNLGATWVGQTSGVSVDLKAVDAVDTNTVYATGASGTILKTTNGGTTWTAQTSGTTNELHGVFAVDANTAFAVGGNGSVSAIALKTTNGGTTWTAITPAQSTKLSDIFAIDANTAYAVGISGGGSGMIQKTTNAGTSWAALTSGTAQNLERIACTDASTCWIVGASGTILKTTDGTTWSAQTSGVAVNLQGIRLFDANTGYVVGASGTILKTTNGGTAWTAQTSGTTQTIDALALLPTGTAGVAVGHSGTIVLSSSSVVLQAHGGNTRAGTPSALNACTSVSLGNDGSGNANRRITCTHGALACGTWYRLLLNGGSTGIQATSGDTMSASTTSRSFRTSFCSNHAFDDPTLSSLASEGYLTINTGSSTAASQATFAAMLRSRVTTSDGTALVTVPQNAVFTRAGGGTFDSTAIALSDYTSSATNVPGTKKAVIQYGISGVSLTSDTAITIAIPVASTVTAGTVLDVYRDTDGNFTDATTKLTTCTVASSSCSFTTTSLSYFAATEPSGSPTQTDTTAPAAPTGFSCTSGSSTATCTWTDPSDTDLANIRMLLVRGDVTYLRGTIAKGTQTFTDPNTDTPTLTAGQTYTFSAQAVDTSGNRSTSATTTVTISAAAPAAQDTTPPSPPTNFKATSSSSKVTLTWKDPADSDLKLLRVLLLRGEATSIRSILSKGLQTYTDSGTDLVPNLSYTYALEAEDTSGNKSSRVTTTITVDSGTAPTSPPTTTTTTTNTAPTNTDGGSPMTTDTTTTHPITTDSGAPKETDTTTTTPVTSETELAKGVKADEPPPAEDPKASKLLKDAVKAITETLSPPCTLTDAERQYLADAFTRSQGRAPSTGGDLQFLCSLRADPEHPVDPTKEFPKFRNLKAETLALKNFVNFFRRPPSRDTQDRPTTPAVAEKDWWAVKYMAYHLRLAPTSRDLTGERTCLRIFLDRDVDLYKDGQKVRKAKGTPPRDLFDYDFIRACTYSGLQFAEAAGAMEE
ncbi:hypothetical protein HY635_01635, partial [Candidatus Uhrbacteria bacterium]|nr:hypothetical protein [Candidatus Uhrbacteria bacterium]